MMKAIEAPLFGLALTCIVGSTAADQVAGYGRDGSRIYPDVTPPTKWAEGAVKWETPLPSWGTGSPIIVAGKVFVLCEPCPGHDFPFLVCLDAETGKQLWLREVDHMAVTGLSEEEQAQTRKDWHDWLADFYQRNGMRARYEAKGADKAALEAEMKAKGWKMGKLVEPSDKRADGRKRKGLHEKAGFITNVSQHHQYCRLNATGLAYGTPVSDGEAIYVHTAFGAVAAYGFDGTQKWMVWAKGSSGNEGCNMGRSTILWDDAHGGMKLVISDIGNLVRVVDRTTGEIRWTDPIQKSHTIVTPAVLTVGEKQVLWTAGCQAYLLPGGKKLSVEGWRDEGMQILVKHDEPDVAFFCGSGEHCGWTKKGGTPPHPPAAVRFTLDEDVLKATVLWHGGTIAEAAGLSGRSVKGVFGGNAPWMLYNDGKFYHRNGALLDALTGKLISGTLAGKARSGRAVPATRHLLCIADGHVYGFNGKGSSNYRGQLTRVGTCEVYTLDGKKVAVNPVQRKEPTEAQKAMFVACGGREEYGGFSYGATFTFAGSSIFFRSWASIVCIGKE